MLQDRNLEDQAEPVSALRLVGARDGPLLQVICAPDLLDAAMDELQGLPALVYLRGELRLQSCAFEGASDDRVTHTIHPEGATAIEACEAIIAHAARLKMLPSRAAARLGQNYRDARKILEASAQSA
ncbi:hypothetical protein C8N43_3531 [Litoreibacter ponti]|uniref:Uncharacterized protein n=1 Tax=Litoreibacter ponti TaxID=1510457 RepID=A0A2T6BF81_9RHOB|nr:hypothetical protein [Litoreibacter ponti]PTX54711.1 hypothetical protein C8N43_3531 [Litoreibacter ponti]